VVTDPVGWRRARTRTWVRTHGGGAPQGCVAPKMMAKTITAAQSPADCGTLWRWRAHSSHGHHVTFSPSDAPTL
jgi:hypothetical protein